MNKQYVNKKTIEIALSKGLIIDKKCTQSMLQRCLREEHNIHTLVYRWKTKDLLWHYRATNVDNTYKTFEEALEAGLQEALKLLSI